MFSTRLTVTLAERSDEGTYYCVSKNELGITRGNIQVFSESTINMGAGADNINFRERSQQTATSKVNGKAGV